MATDLCQKLEHSKKGEYMARDEMYEIVHQATYRFFGNRLTVQIGDGWNVRNWSIYCEV